MTHATNDELRDALMRLARWVWNKSTEAHRLGVSFNEETITEMLLLKLARKFSHRGLSIRSFSKYEEGTSYLGGPPTGADWEFWISDATGKGLYLRVQAKRLFLKSGTYESFDTSKPQHKKLIGNAGTATPIYVFYNAQSRKLDPHWPFHTVRCCHFWPPFAHFKRTWGVCFDLAKNLSGTKANPAPKDIPNMLPWHCLMCPCRNADDKSLPESVASALQMLGDSKMELSEEKPSWVAQLADGVDRLVTGDGEKSILPEGVSHIVHIQDTRRARAE
jgi:hypothetical protein